MQEQDFYNYSLYIKDERDYHRNWVFAVFKSYYGKWNTKKLKEQGKPIKPTQEYLDWLYSYQEKWVSSKKWYKRVRDTIFRGGISFCLLRLRAAPKQDQKASTQICYYIITCLGISVCFLILTVLDLVLILVLL